MPTDHGAGRSTSRRYSDEEKRAAVRMVRSLRAETGSMTGTVRRVADPEDLPVGSVAGRAADRLPERQPQPEQALTDPDRRPEPAPVAIAAVAVGAPAAP
jgi:hypothetical protein